MVGEALWISDRDCDIIRNVDTNLETKGNRKRTEYKDFQL